MKKVINKYQTTAHILGIPVTGTPKLELLRQIKKNLMKLDTRQAKQPPIVISTPNPEQILLSLHDPEFKVILRSSTYLLPDGYGLAVAFKYLNLYSPKFLPLRIPISFLQGLWVAILAVFSRKSVENRFKVIKGRQFFLDLIQLANAKKWRVFLLGGENDVAEKAVRALSLKFKKAKFDYHPGPMLDINGSPLKGNTPADNRLLEKEAVNQINKFRPHLLFVGFGAPKQEKWLYRHRNELDLGAAMVLGGTFDYIAGTAKLPPNLVAGKSEWLWRLITQPKIRIKRIINAIIVFPFKVFMYKLRSQTSQS